jgi:hypothetical protein
MSLRDIRRELTQLNFVIVDKLPQAAYNCQDAICVWEGAQFVKALPQ